MKNELRFVIMGCFVCLSTAVMSQNVEQAEKTASSDRVEAELAARISSLERQLTGAKGIISENRAGDSDGYLEVLRRKALAFESSSVAIAEKDREIVDLKKKLSLSEATADTLSKQMEALHSATNRMSARILILEEEGKPLKEALRLIRKGKFEYYEIKAGDTCESIAAQAEIYKDETKHVLIRQANRGGIADLDSLVPGEVLVIPRFAIGGSYEF